MSKRLCDIKKSIFFVISQNSDDFVISQNSDDFCDITK